MRLYSLGAAPRTLSNCHPHSHELWEISVNVLGEGKTWIGEECYSFTEGTILCIPPGMEHSKRSQEGFVDYYFHTEEFLTADNRQVPADRPVLLQDDSEKSFERLVRLFLNLHYQKKLEERPVVLSLFRAAMQLLAAWMAGGSAVPLVDQVKSRIIAGFADPELDLKEILSSGNYTENYMRRKFREQTGLTPTEYLARLRVDYAKQLLEQKKLLNLSIGDIAGMCGYYDERYFSRVFRAKTGMSPREYLLQSGLSDGGPEDA